MIFYRAIAWLPFPVLYFLAWLGYLLLYYVTGYRKRVVTQNLANAFPDKSANEITVLAKKFYRQLAQVAFEILKSQRMKPEDFKKRCRIINPELIQKLSKDSTQSLILLTIHQGNWEWMLHGTSMGLNAPVDAVYKPLHNKTADQLIYEIRTRFGSNPFPIADSAKNIIRRRKEFRLLVMVADQSPIRSERSHWMQFMNQPAAFYLGAETIAKMTKFPVVFAQCHRRSTGYYEIEFHELGTPPYDKQSHEITERFVALAEKAIEDEPESWLWSNRRWKRDPEAEAALADATGE